MSEAAHSERSRRAPTRWTSTIRGSSRDPFAAYRRGLRRELPAGPLQQAWRLLADDPLRGCAGRRHQLARLHLERRRRHRDPGHHATHRADAADRDRPAAPFALPRAGQSGVRAGARRRNHAAHQGDRRRARSSTHGGEGHGRGGLGRICVPVAITSLAAFTDVPLADSERWVGWITRMFDVSDPVAGAAASRELVAYIDGLIAARRAAPTGDFISTADRGRDRRRTARRRPDTLVHDGGVRRRLRDHRRRAFGHAATGSPNIRRGWRGLAAEPALIPTAVEEFLRFAAPIQIFGRNATPRPRPARPHDCAPATSSRSASGPQTAIRRCSSGRTKCGSTAGRTGISPSAPGRISAPGPAWPAWKWR